MILLRKAVELLFHLFSFCRFDDPIGYHHNAITAMTKTSGLDSHAHPHLRNMQGKDTKEHCQNIRRTHSLLGISFAQLVSCVQSSYSRFVSFRSVFFSLPQ